MAKSTPAAKAKSSTRKTTKKSTPKAKPASRKAKPSSRKSKSAASEEEVTIDRRRANRRKAGSADEAASPESAEPLKPRKKVSRRRQIDPTTCERDYSEQEVEFMNALDEYKRASGRMFPTCSEVLEVIRSLGYVQLTAAEIAARTPPAVESETDEPPAGEQDSFDANLFEESEEAEEALASEF